MELTGIISLLYIYIAVTNACPELCECDQNMEKLTCRGVKLTPEYLLTLVLPETIKEVYFINNDLSTISSAVLRPFRRVEKLVIKQNLIAEIPPYTFQEFENLTSLEINNNKLHELNKHVFSGLNKLNDLVVSYNEVTDLYPGIFDTLPAIKSIKMMHNKIREIPNGVFTKLRSLSKLFMSNNEIASLGAEAFQNMSMNRIDLSSNKIKRLPRSTFKNLRIERNILLFRNHFDCACKDLMSYSKYFTGLKMMGGQCVAPLNLKGENIQSAYMKTDCTLCDLEMCRNGGTCQGNKTAFSCMCSDQYKGHMCERSICQPEIRYVNQVVQVRTTFIPFHSSMGTEFLMRKTVLSVISDAMNLF